MAASMNYRLAPEVTWKEQVEDVLLALDFIRAQQQVDTQRIALWATSAGAHLALLVAALRTKPDPMCRNDWSCHAPCRSRFRSHKRSLPQSPMNFV